MATPPLRPKRAAFGGAGLRSESARKQSFSNDGSVGEQTATQTIPLTYMCMTSASVLPLYWGTRKRVDTLPKRAAAFGGDTKIFVKRVSRPPVLRDEPKQKRTCQAMAIQRAMRNNVSQTEDKTPYSDALQTRRQPGDSSEGDRTEPIRNHLCVRLLEKRRDLSALRHRVGPWTLGRRALPIRAKAISITC